MSAVNVKLWQQLVKSRPLYERVVKSLHQKPMSFYDLKEAFSSSTHVVLKELLDIGIIEVVSEEKMLNGQVKKMYSLTELGRRLAE